MTAGAASHWDGRDCDGPDFDGVAPQRVLAGPGTITVIAGLTFAISDERGDMGPGPFGLITDDTRHLSRLQVRLDSEPLRHLGSGLISPAVARFRGYATLSNRLPDAPVECERLRRLSPAGMAETLTLRCWTPDTIQVRLSIQLDSDFADIFQVRRLAVILARRRPASRCIIRRDSCASRPPGLRAPHRCSWIRPPTSSTRVQHTGSCA